MISSAKLICILISSHILCVPQLYIADTIGGVAHVTLAIFHGTADRSRPLEAICLDLDLPRSGAPFTNME